MAAHIITLVQFLYLKKKNKMSVNNLCQLKNFKNIFIIDGSVFDFKINKYPLGLVMANARRVAKEIKK